MSAPSRAASAKQLTGRGDHVFATMRNPEGKNRPPAETLLLSLPRLQHQDRHDGRNAETDRQHTRTDARTHEEVASALPYMPSRVPLPKVRGYHRSTKNRKPHLTAMSVARHRERDTLGHVGEDVGIVGIDDHGHPVGNLSKRLIDVMLTGT